MRFDDAGEIPGGNEGVGWEPGVPLGEEVIRGSEDQSTPTLSLFSSLAPREEQPLLGSSSQPVGRYETAPPDPVAEIRRQLEAVERCRERGDDAARDEVIEGLSDYIAGYLDKPALSALRSVLAPAGADGVAYDAEMVAEFQDALHHALVGEPAAQILSALQVPAGDLASSILEAMPIAVIDQELGDIKTWIEIGGFAIGILTGHLHVAWACLKELARDVFHRKVKEAVKALLTGGSRVTGTEQARSAVGEAASSREPRSPERLAAPATLDSGPLPQPRAALQKPKEHRPHAEESTAGDLAIAEAGTAAQTRHAGTGHAASPTRRPSPGATARSHDTAASASHGVPGTKETGTQAHPDGNWHSPEMADAGGQESTSLPPAQVAPSASPVPQALPAAQEATEFIRLDVYYHPPLTGALAASDLAALLAVVLVKRTSFGDAPDGAAASARWEQWAAADSRGFIAGSPAADALRHRLRALLTGEPANMPTRAMTVERLPARPAVLDAFLWRRLVIVAMIGDGHGRAMLQGAGIRVRRRKPQDFDGFAHVVASAISGLISVGGAAQDPLT